MFFCDYQGGVLVIVAPSDSGGMLRMYANTLQSEYINPSTHVCFDSSSYWLR